MSVRTRIGRASSTAQPTDIPNITTTAATSSCSSSTATSSKSNPTAKGSVPANDRNGHIVAVIDPSNVWPRVSPLLSQRLPLGDVPWKVKVDGKVELIIVPQVGVKFTPEADTHFAGEEMFVNMHRRPSLYMYFVDGDARDDFKKNGKKAVQDFMAKRSNQSYLIVVVNSTAQQTKLFQTPVIEQIKSFVPRKDRAIGLRLNEPGQEQWFQLIAKMKEGLVESFEANLHAVKEEASRVYKGHNDRGWRFSDIFLIKQCVARMYEQSRLFQQAYEEYESIRTMFHHRLRIEDKEDFHDQSFAEGVSASSTAILLELGKDVGVKITSQPVTRFDFEQYLFALKANILLEMNDINKFLEDAKEFIAYGLDYLSKKAKDLQPGFIEAWVFTASMTVANAALFAVSNASSDESQSEFSVPKSPLLRFQPQQPEEMVDEKKSKKGKYHARSRSMLVDAGGFKTPSVPVTPPSSLRRKQADETLFDASREKPLDVCTVSLEQGAPVKLQGQFQLLSLNLESTGTSATMKDTLYYIADFFLIARSQLNKVAIALGLSDNKGFLSSLVQALQSLELPEEFLMDTEGDLNETGDDNDLIIEETDDRSEMSMACNVSPSTFSMTDFGSQSATGTAADGSASFDSNSEIGDDFSIVDSSPIPSHIAPPVITKAYNGETSVVSVSPEGEGIPVSPVSGSVREKVLTESSSSSSSSSFEGQPMPLSPSRSLRLQSGGGSNSGIRGTGSSGSGKSGRMVAKSPSLLRRLVGESNAFGDVGQVEQGSLQNVQIQKLKVKKSKSKSKKSKKSKTKSKSKKVRLIHPTVVSLPPGLSLEQIQDVVQDKQMIDALVSKEAFADAFLQLSLKARAAFEEAGKMRSAERLSRELGLVLYNTQCFDKAESLLAETATAFCDKGWTQFGLYYSVILADCYNRLGHFIEYADCCLRMLENTEEAEEKAYFSELLLGMVSSKLQEPLSRPLTESVFSMSIVPPLNPPDSCTAGTELSATCSVVSTIPRSVAVDSIVAELTKVSDGLPAQILLSISSTREGEGEQAEPIKINPGMNTFTLKAVPNNPGEYHFTSLYIQRGQLRLVESNHFDSLPTVICTKPKSDIEFHAVLPSWMPLKTKFSNSLHMHLETNTTSVKELLCSVVFPNIDSVHQQTSANIEISGHDSGDKMVLSNPVTSTGVTIGVIPPQKSVDVTYPLYSTDYTGQLAVKALASVTDSNGVRFDFEQTKAFPCSVPFAVRTVSDLYPGEEGSALFIVRATVSSTAQIPLQIIRAVLLSESDESVYAEGMGSDTETILVEPQNKAHLTFMKPLPASNRIPPNQLTLQIDFLYNATPDVQYRDSMSIPVALTVPKPLFNVSISCDDLQTVKVCEPHNFVFRVSRNPMMSADEIKTRLRELRKAGLIVPLGDDKKDGMVVGLSTAEGTWQELGAWSTSMFTDPIIAGDDWQHTFTLIPLRTGYLPIPFLRLSHGLDASNVFSSGQLYVKAVPELTCLLTCRITDEGKIGGAPSRYHAQDDSASSFVMQAEERRRYKMIVANSNIVVCWFDSASLSQNRASDIFKKAVDKLSARDVTVQVNVVTTIDQLLRWVREMGSEVVRTIALAGKLRIIVSCSPQADGDDPAAINALLCMAQIPELSFVPIFVQCRSIPAAVSSLDNLIFVSDPVKLVSMVTVAPKEPAQLFSPSVLKTMNQTPQTLAARLLEADDDEPEITSTTTTKAADESSTAGTTKETQSQPTTVKEEEANPHSSTTSPSSEFVKIVGNERVAVEAFSGSNDSSEASHTRTDSESAKSMLQRPQYPPPQPPNKSK